MRWFQFDFDFGEHVTRASVVVASEREWEARPLSREPQWSVRRANDDGEVIAVKCDEFLKNPVVEAAIHATPASN